MNALILAFACWNLVLIDLTFGQEFEAGSFILTQNSLNEAPYRYAGVLRRILDKVEKKDPPSQSDEENCNILHFLILEKRLSFKKQDIGQSSRFNGTHHERTGKRENPPNYMKPDSLCRRKESFI